MTSPYIFCAFFLIIFPGEAVFQPSAPISRYVSLEKASTVLIDDLAANLSPETHADKLMMIYDVAASGPVEWNRDSLYRLFSERLTAKKEIDLFGDGYDRYLKGELGLYPSDRIDAAAVAEYAENMAIPYIIGASIEPEDRGLGVSENRPYLLTIHVTEARTKNIVWIGQVGFQLQKNDPLILW